MKVTLPDAPPEPSRQVSPHRHATGRRAISLQPLEGATMTVAEQSLTRTDAGQLADLGAGSPLPVFSGPMMTKALVAYKELQTALDLAMPDQIMDLDGKKFRKKGYWRAVAVAFNLNVELVEEQREVDGLFADNRENFGWRVTYKATAANGRSVTGDGSCFAVEKAKRFKCPHPDPARENWALHFPPEKCPDYDPNFQWTTLPQGATEHNVRSHAQTRAFNRAVSNLVGFGEVSAEEVQQETGHDTAPATAKSVTPARADGATYVAKVEIGGEKKPTRVTLADGQSGTTFDTKLVAAATKAKADHALVIPRFEDVQKGNRTYKNLMALDAPGSNGAAKEEPASATITADTSGAADGDDTEPVGQPEKVLTVREVKAASAYHVVQTDRRTYVTNKEPIVTMAEALRAAKGYAIVTFKVSTSAQHKYNVIDTLVEAPAPAAGDMFGS